MPFPRFLPGFLYLLDLIFHPTPPKRERLFSISITRVTFYDKVIQVPALPYYIGVY